MFENFFGKSQQESDDEKKMERNLAHAKKILGEDDHAMEKLVAGANEILRQAAEDEERGKRESAISEYNAAREHFDDFDDDLIEEEVEKIENLLGEITERLLDETSNFYTNTDKGSVSELFYRIITEEVPDLGVSINEIARVPKTGEILKGCVAVETTPYKTDRAFLFELGENSIIRVLESPQNHKDEGKRLEEEELLPRGVTRKALSREYRSYMARWPDSAEFWQDTLKREGLEHTEPLSDDEAKEIMRPIIQGAYRKKLGLE